MRRAIARTPTLVLLGTSWLVACAVDARAPAARPKPEPAPGPAPTAMTAHVNATDEVPVLASSPAGALAAASAHARALAAAGWSDAPVEAGNVIAELANVVAAYDGASRAHAELVFQSRRLSRPARGVFDEVRWIESALSTALAALEARSGETAATRDARQAIDSIDPRRSIAFQRAPIQDAVRATLVAYVLAHQRCENTRSARRSP
jgi:hypothetical protein